MNQIPIIRKGKINSYLINGLIAGIVFGLITFFNTIGKNSVENAIFFSIISIILIILIWVGVGFLSEEYFIRKKKIKELYSSKYDFLDKNNFVLDQDLYFDGVYKNFTFKVLPINRPVKDEKGKDKLIEKIIIETYYDLNNDFDNELLTEDELNEKINNSNLFDNTTKYVYFSSNSLGMIQINSIDINLKNSFDILIEISKQFNLIPLNREEWYEMYGKKILIQQQDEINSRTKDILKVGKLNIQYLKPDK